MSKQEDTLMSIATRHGIQKGQAEEVWILFGRFIANVINEDKTNEEGLLDQDKFKVIHIDNFGKFVCKPKYIKRKNKIKLESHES